MSRTFLIDNIEDVVLEVLHTEDDRGPGLDAGNLADNVLEPDEVLDIGSSASRTLPSLSGPRGRGPRPRVRPRPRPSVLVGWCS